MERNNWKGITEMNLTEAKWTELNLSELNRTGMNFSEVNGMELSAFCEVKLRLTINM